MGEMTTSAEWPVTYFDWADGALQEMKHLPFQDALDDLKGYVKKEIIDPIIEELLCKHKMNSSSTKPWVAMQQAAMRKSARLTRARHGKHTQTRAAVRTRSRP